MKADRVLTVRRAINEQRRARLSEEAIAQWLTAAKVAPPSSAAWRRAGVGPSWSGPAVTRFMECTRHVRPAPSTKVTATAPAGATPKLRVKGIRGDFIRTAAPTPP